MAGRLLTLLSLALAAGALAASPAGASELIDRNATSVELAADGDGQALLSYNARGRRWNVLVWGAVNAIHPTTARKQTAFGLDYSGGWGTRRKQVWRTFQNRCTRYDGPPLKWLVTACKAPDGSYWAVQAWQRMLPNYGLVPSREQAAWELRLSHWSGPLPVLEVNLNWAYRQYDHLFGRFTYRGRPVHGFRVTPTGQPLDTFGRNLYLDTFNSAYGGGWRRENSFLMHRGSGAFCYGLYPHDGRPSGNGERYRATIIGPGVTPDVHWEASAPGPYDPEADRAANALIRGLGSGQCKPN